MNYFRYLKRFQINYAKTILLKSRDCELDCVFRVFDETLLLIEQFRANETIKIVKLLKIFCVKLCN